MTWVTHVYQNKREKKATDRKRDGERLRVWAADTAYGMLSRFNHSYSDTYFNELLNDLDSFFHFPSDAMIVSGITCKIICVFFFSLHHSYHFRSYCSLYKMYNHFCLVWTRKNGTKWTHTRTQFKLNKKISKSIEVIVSQKFFE